MQEQAARELDKEKARAEPLADCQLRGDATAGAHLPGPGSAGSAMANADNDGAAERAVKDYASLEGRVSKEALERAGMKRVDTSKRFMGPKDASRTK